MRNDYARTLFAVSIILGVGFVQQLGAQCGVERWSVKTGTDSGASSIDVNSASPTTIATLANLPAPNPIPADSRVQPTETTVWTISATLVGFKVENDSDYHLVMTDGAGNTMIAEIPAPSCVDSSSPFSSAITQARSQFDSMFTVTPSLQHVNIPVQITGVGMFDFLHGATGAAPNGIELHPVLRFSTGGLTVSATPAALSIPAGGSGTANVSVSGSGSGAPNTDVSLSLSGNPSDITGAFNPATLTPPGTASLTLSVGQAVAVGDYPLTVTASSGATSTANLDLTVTQAASQDFSLSASPAALALIPGNSASTSVSTAAIGSFASDISLSTTGLPPGINASFNPVTISSPGNGASTLTMTADPSAAGGMFTFQIGASGGGVTHQTPVGVNLCNAAPPPMSIRPRSRVTSAPARVSEGMVNTARDDDDGRIQIIPTKEALLEARQHGGEPICSPRQVDIFLGSSWADAANRAQKSALARLTANIAAPAICGNRAVTQPVQAVYDELDKTLGETTDLQIQKRIVTMLSDRKLQKPTSTSIYLVLLAPAIHSKVDGLAAERSYLAYHNHFHSTAGDIRYAVVPFDTDQHRQERTVNRVILEMLINPDGLSW